MIFALIRLKVVEDHPGRGFWEVYRENHQVIQPYLGELGALVERLSMDPRIRLVGTAGDDLYAAMNHMNRYAFLPRDAIHLAVMARLGLDGIVTTDDDFATVDGLCLFTCNPRMLSQA
jgi:predicted nucleic acid-binding protein